MARKVFWALWIIVWPIAAIAPYVINPPVTVKAQAPAQARTRKPESRERANPKLDREILANRIASAKESRIPLLAQTDNIVEVQQWPSQPELTVPTQVAQAPKKGESLPPTLERPRARQTDVSTRVSKPHETTDSLAAQAERAQRLIQERAAARGLQRHARLELKYRRGAHISTAPARWQPRVTGTGWVTGSRAKP